MARVVRIALSCTVGGFTEAMKVAGWCEAHYIDLMPHNVSDSSHSLQMVQLCGATDFVLRRQPLGPVSTAACIHLGAAVPNFAYLEDNFSMENMHSQWDSKVCIPVNQACSCGDRSHLLMLKAFVDAGVPETADARNVNRTPRHAWVPCTD